MTIIAVDDTDSRTQGMCTTYVGHKIAEDLENRNEDVYRVLLVRLNPAAKHKTRGNAAVAIHTSADCEISLRIASNRIDDMSADDTDRTNPSVVVSPADSVSESVRDFASETLTELKDIEEAKQVIDKNDLLSYYRGNGRGRIGCVAAIGSWSELDDWTYEHITYRAKKNRGSKRLVDRDSVFRWADKTYPLTWDTVDRKVGKAVCVPTAPGPILYGVRGDSEQKTEIMGKNINVDEIVESSRLFITNQGTDAHIVSAGTLEEMTDNTSYKVDGTVCSEPRTQEGGHVFFNISDETSSIKAAAFEPTKHFRDIVRKLKVGDSVTLLGEFSDGCIKIEKMRLDHLNRTQFVNPTCDSCEISMSSAGKNQGYRCRKCGQTSQSKNKVNIDRGIEEGWYEVPPCARRHISKPLARASFDQKKHIFK